MHHDHWREYTDAEIGKVKREHCVKCLYSSYNGKKTGEQKKHFASMTCDYGLYEGNPYLQRPRPDECPYWKHKKTGKRRGIDGKCASRVAR